jgi:hypothetical protein
MAKGKLPPQLVAYWDKKNKKADAEDSKTEEGKARITTRKAQKAVEAARAFKDSKKEGKKQEEAKEQK